LDWLRNEFGKYLAKILQGLSELAVNSFRLMTTEGLTPSLLALNSLINAFGEDRRDAEAFAVLQYMKENVCFSNIFLLFPSFKAIPFYMVFDLCLCSSTDLFVYINCRTLNLMWLLIPHL